MADSQQRNWFGLGSFHRPKMARRKTPYGCQLGFEALEERQLLSISWTNKGVSAGDDNDRFDLVFGPLAGQARGVVDAAIDFWERSINSFNYGDGGNDVYELKVQMNEFPLPAGSGVGANGGFGDTRNNKPSTGSMGIGWLLGVTPGNNSAAGYFLDPTPYESSEFQGTWRNGFTRQNTDNLGGADLFTLVLHELGHAMGLAATEQTDAFAIDTESVDNVNTPASSPVSTLWLFDNGSLWTEWDSGGASGTPSNAAGAQHFAPLGTSAVRLGVTYSGAVALMNASFTSRSIISDIEMDAARLAYGYTVTPPSTYGTTYGQLDANGTLRIDTSSLGNSADAITLSVSGSVLSLTLDTGAPVAGIDPTGPFTSIFAASSVFRVEIDAGGGADVITVGGLGGVPISLGGGNGDDSLIINGATGNNTLSGSSYAGGAHNITSYSSIENVTLNGTAGNENFNVSRATLIGPDTVVVNGFDGADNVVLGSGDLQFSAPYSYFFFDGGGSDDGIALNNAAQNTLNWQYGIYAAYADAFAAGYYLQANYASVENITIQGSMRSDQFIPDSDSGVTANLFGNDGDDNFIVGGGNVGFLPAWILNGGNGNDAITFDNHLATINHTVEFQSNQVVFYSGVFTISTVGFETVGWLGGVGNDQVRISGNMTQGLNIDAGLGNDTIVVGYSSPAQFVGNNIINGGEGNDSFTWRAANNVVNDGFSINTFEVALDGGAGFNSLTVDDAMRGSTLYDIYSDRLKAKDVLSTAWADFDYDNMNSLGVIASGSANSAKVFGVSSDIPAGQQMTLLMGGGSDNVTVVPRDNNGDLTINGNLGIGGGAGTDSLYVDDSASSAPAAYAFANFFGAGTQNITGLGSAGFGIGSDFEAITMTGSTGDDVYDINSYKSGMGLTINAGLGDDVCNFGNGDVAANVTSIASFLFNGMEGTDTFNLRNANPANSFTYAAAGNTTLQVSRTFPSSYFVSLEYYNTEQKAVYAGPAVDIMNITSFASGELSFHGAGGDDALNLPTSSDLLGRRVNFFGDAGTANRVNQVTNSKTAPSTLHVAQNTIGAFAGDNFFAPGGSLFFESVQIIGLRMGSGADTAYMQPDPVAAINIIGGNPTTAPGDNFRLSLAGVTNPVFTPNGAGAGTYTFGNVAAVNYTGFETASAYLPGDFSGDGIVGPEDYDVWKASFGMAVAPGTLGDGNDDGIVDAADYVVWRNNFGAGNPGAGSGVSASAAPLQPVVSINRTALAEPLTAERQFPASLESGVPTAPVRPHVAIRDRLPTGADITHFSRESDRRTVGPRFNSTALRNDAALMAWLSTSSRGNWTPDDSEEAVVAVDTSENDAQDDQFHTIDFVFETFGADVALGHRVM